MPRSKQTATSAPVEPPKPLTDFQENVLSLCADMIMNGGEEDDVTNLLRAAIGHSIHIRFSGYDTCIRIALDLPDWRKRLMRYWPKEIEPKPDLPKTVTEILRTKIRDDVKSNFNDFMSRARMHEIYLMQSVLANFDSEGGQIDDESAESMLARAFLQELGTDYSYLKVPDGHVEAVEEFLKHIDEAPAVAVPEPVGRPKLLAFEPRHAIQDEPAHAS